MTCEEETWREDLKFYKAQTLDLVRQLKEKTTVVCKARTCIANKNSKCSLPEIEIDAKYTTWCQSYIRRKEDSDDCGASAC